METTQLGKYRLLALLATGGMAEVLLAKTSGVAGFEKLVVIKRILPDLVREERIVNMFLDEAKLAASLNHPNVIQIFDFGKVNGRYFMAMEYLFGESVSYIIRNCANMKWMIPEEICAGIILQAAQGLHYAHTLCDFSGNPLNIVHRDVSPQNIFVLFDGVVKMVDFGIAKATTSSQKTQTGTLKGKFAYMSPEQVAGGALDARSDVFSLGIVFWELLCGRKLFRQENEFDIMKAIVERDAPPVSSTRTEIHPELERIVARALCRDRDQRYQSAGELQEDLRVFLQKSGKAWDSVAISAFIKQAFGGRIKQKQVFLQQVQQHEKNLEEVLFGDGVRELVSDTEYSVPNTTPSHMVLEEKQKKNNTHYLLWLTPLLTILIFVGGYFLVRNIEPAVLPQPPDLPQAKDQGKNQQGVLEPHNEADAGSDPKAPENPESGVPNAQPDQPLTAVVNDKNESTDEKPKTPVELPLRRPTVRADTRPKGTGFLRLTTQPWTEVWFRGKKLGQTPLLDVELPAGVVQLRLVNREAKIDKTIKIEIAAGKNIRKKIELE